MTPGTLDLLRWLEERPRTYTETIDAWRTSCPRLSVWEDAIADGLVAIGGRGVVVTRAGADALAARSA